MKQEAVDWRKVVKHLKGTCTEIAKFCAEGTFDWKQKEPVIDVLHAIATAIEYGLPKTLSKLAAHTKTTKWIRTKKPRKAKP